MSGTDTIVYLMLYWGLAIQSLWIMYCVINVALADTQLQLHRPQQTTPSLKQLGIVFADDEFSMNVLLYYTTMTCSAFTCVLNSLVGVNWTFTIRQLE